MPRPGLKKTGFLVLRAWRGVLKSTTLDNTNAIAEAICRRAYPPKKVRNRLPAPRRFARGAFVHFGTTSPCEIGRSLRFDPLWVGGWLTAEARPFRLTVPLLSTSSHAFLRAACATIRRLCDPRPVFAPSDLPDLDPAPSAQEYPSLRRLSNEPSFSRHHSNPIVRLQYPFRELSSNPSRFGHDSPLARSGRGLEGLRSSCQPQQLKGEGPRAALVHPLASLVRRAGRFPRTLCPCPRSRPGCTVLPSRPRPASCCSLAMG